MLKSFPPCSLKPHGAGPFRVTVYELILGQTSTLLPLTTPACCVFSPPGAVFPSSTDILLSRSASVVASSPSGLAYLPVCSQLSGQTPWGGVGVGWVGQVLWDLCDTHTGMHWYTQIHIREDSHTQKASAEQS